MIGSGWGKRDM